MNIISKQYCEFLSILQEIFRITNSKEVKITKVDKGIICFQNEKGNNVEISTAHDVVQYCSNDYKNRKLFTYDGVKIQPIGKGNDESVSKISLVYNQEEINFFSFTINCLAKDYENPKKSKELKKTLSITQIISYLTKFTIDPIYTRLLYNHIDNDDLVQPLIGTMGQIKNFLERNKMLHFNRLSIDKENKTISFGFVNKEITMSQNDISTASKNRYSTDYVGSIFECLDEEIKSNVIITRQTFTADQFYEKLLSYNKRFDCLVPLKLVTSTTEDQKTDKFTNVQEEYSVSPSYMQTLTSSSTEHSNLIPCKPCSNEQQFSASSLILIGAMSGFIILLVLALAYYCYKKRNSDKVRTGVGAVELAPLNNERHCN